MGGRAEWGAGQRHDAVRPGAPAARLGGLVATGLLEVSEDPGVLDTAGRWAVVLPYSGTPVFARFDSWRPGPAAMTAGEWRGPATWRSSLDREAYESAVSAVRERIARGDVYQANVCRIMSARLPDPDRADIGGLHALLDRGNPAPHSGMLRLPDHGVHIATASPELFLSRRGDVIESAPIKGTGRTAADLLDKDIAENVMIVDLVRNDLSRVCRPGEVTVPRLLEVEEHPGLVHLVSTVRGRLIAGTGWEEILAAAFPPGSVTGAPKEAARRIIAENEPVEREVYCGAVGWVDADRREAELAVAIRTFWRSGEALGDLRFGTGAGITWSSDPAGEWAETELKADRLHRLAGQEWTMGS